MNGYIETVWHIGRRFRRILFYFHVPRPGWKRSLLARTLLAVLGLALIGVSACMLSPDARKAKYFHRAQSDVEHGRNSEAAILLVKALKIDPAYADAHAILAHVFLNLNQPGNAYREFARTLEIRPDDYGTRQELIAFLIARRDFKLAQQQLDVLFKQRPEAPATHMAASSLLATQGKVPEAIGEAEKTIALAPGHWEAYLALAILQENSQQPASAEASFKKVVELHPSSPQPYVLLGNFYWSQQRLSDAEQQYRQAVATGPTTFLARDALAQLYVAQGRTRDAEQTLKQAIHDLPGLPESYVALSEFYLSSGNADKALEQSAELYHIHPKDLEIEERYIALLIATRHYDDAHRLNEELLKLIPGDSEALICRGRMQMIAGDYYGAAASFQSALKNSPNDAEAHYMLGEVNHARGDLVHDQTEWQESVQLNPNQVQAQRELARVAMRQGNMVSLRGYAEQIVRLAPRSPDGYALMALCDINENHPAAAEEEVRKAIAADPGDSFGYVQEGNLRMVQKRYSDAEKSYRAALDRNPGSSDGLRGLMGALADQHLNDKAVAAANAQIAKVPNNGALYNLLGDALYHLKADLPGAEKAYAQSLALNRSNTDALLNLCEVRAAKGDLDAAIGAGEQYLKGDPNNVSVLLLTGNLYQAKNDWYRAADAYKKVLAVDTLNPVGANELARVELENGENPDHALQLAQTAVKGMPEAPRVYDTLGWVYYRKSIYPLAIANFKEALTLQDKKKMADNADVHYHLGLAYEKGGQPALARQQFQRALQINPKYRDAGRIQNELAHLQS